jgi:hypothetical protein
MADEIEALHRARDAARSFAAAVREMAEFLQRTSAVPEPEQEAEYATLLAKEQSTYRQRQMALRDLGLRADSIEPADT